MLNIVHGLGAECGAPLRVHPDVRAISFTGGTATGAAIHGATAPSFKKVALEMGGKNPNIVFADADLPQAIETGLRSSFANQGQICLCGSRIFVERPAYREFLDGLVQGAQTLRCGDPLEEQTQQGALVSRDHLDKVRSYIELACREGGQIAVGGQRPSGLPDRCADGFFLQPTVVTDLAPDARCNQEEIFGPVVSVTPFDDEREVVRHANGTRYGLAASIWTRDLARAHRVAAAVDSGTIWINCWMLRDLRVPFGGMKDSGMGREGGDEALRFFTEPKNICLSVDEEPKPQ